VGYTGGCSIWIWFVEILDNNMILALEKEIDGTANPALGTDMTGKFRYRTGASTRAVFSTIPYPIEYAK